jgi:hypothetical protein
LPSPPAKFQRAPLIKPSTFLGPLQVHTFLGEEGNGDGALGWELGFRVSNNMSGGDVLTEWRMSDEDEESDEIGKIVENIYGRKEDPEPTYLEIGRFIAEFSTLEAMMYSYLVRGARVDRRFWAAIVTHDFALMCTAVEQVFSTLEPSIAEDLKSIIRRCRALNDLRVRVVHGEWAAGRKEGYLLHVSRQTLKPNRWEGMRKLLEQEVQTAVELQRKIDSLLNPIAMPILEQELKREEELGVHVEGDTTIDDDKD